MRVRFFRFTIRRLILLVAVIGVFGGTAAEVLVHQPKREARRQEIAGLRRRADAIRAFIRAFPAIADRQEDSRELADRFDHLADEIEGGETVDREEIRESIVQLVSGLALVLEPQESDSLRQ